MPSPFGPSHYDYLEEVLPDFFEAIGVRWDFNRGIVGAHGDKAYCYRQKWEENGLHFYHGVAIFLATYCRPYAQEVRETEDGWVYVEDWILRNKDRFLPHLPDASEWIKQHYGEDYVGRT